MKILIFRTFPSILDPDGYNIQEIGFAKAVVKAGHICDVILFNGSNGDAIKEIDVTDKGHVVGKIKVYMRHGVGILKNGFFPGVKNIINEYDIIQVHEYDQISSWLYYAWSKKKVVIYHGPYYDSFNNGYNLKCTVFDKTFLKIKNNKNTLCFTKSRAAAKFLCDKGFNNVKPIGVGLDIDNFNSASYGNAVLPQDFLSSIEGKWNAVYVGKIEPRRNSMMLLDVMERVAKESKDIHFVVVGDGEADYVQLWMDKAKPLIEKGVLAYVKKLTQAQLKLLYKEMKVMVFPSNYEIFGMVLLEAMFFDLPVISSDNGGSDMLITDKEDGIIIRNFEVEQWAESIIKMHDDVKLYDEIHRCLVERNHNRYLWEGIVEKYLNSFDER